MSRCALVIYHFLESNNQLLVPRLECLAIFLDGLTVWKWDGYPRAFYHHEDIHEIKHARRQSVQEQKNIGIFPAKI